MTPARFPPLAPTLLALLGALALHFSGACAATNTPVGHAPSACPIADYRSVVENLGGDGDGRHAAGSPSNFKAMRYIEEQFASAELLGGGEQGGFRQCFGTAEGGRACNVVGLIPGRGSLAHQAVLVLAHFDRHPTATPSPAASAQGLDDNASGAAGLVALAAMLPRPITGPPRRTLVLLATNGTRTQRSGLARYVASPPVALADTTLAVTLHRIGGAPGTLRASLLGMTPSQWATLAPTSPATPTVSPHVTCGCDDARPLAAKALPVVALTTARSSRAPQQTLDWRGAAGVLEYAARLLQVALHR